MAVPHFHRFLRPGSLACMHVRANGMIYMQGVWRREEGDFWGDENKACHDILTCKKDERT
jgi:hypothetical protein